MSTVSWRWWLWLAVLLAMFGALIYQRRPVDGWRAWRRALSASIDQRPRRWLLIVVLAALGLRMAFLLIDVGATVGWPGGNGPVPSLPPVCHAPDSESYFIPALGLFTDRAFGAPSAWSRNGLPTIELARTPGYPLQLAAGIWLERSAGVPQLFTLLGAQWLLSALCCWLMYCAARELTTAPAAALAAAGLWGMEPLTAVFSLKVLSETLFVTCLLAWLVLLLRLAGRGGWFRAIAAGVLLAAAVYVRPVAYFLAMPTAVALVWCRRAAGRAWPVALAQPLLYVLVVAGCLVPWHWRNWSATRYWRFSAIGDVNLFEYYAPAVLAAQDGQPFARWQDWNRYHFRQQLQMTLPPGAPPGAIYDALRKSGWDVVSHSPLLALRIHLQGTLRLLLDPGATELGRLSFRQDSEGLLGQVLDHGPLHVLWQLLRTRPGLLAAEAALGLLLAVYFLLAVRGTLRLARAWRAGAGLLWSIVIYFVLVSGGPMITARFRVPLLPVICLLAGLAWLPRERVTGPAPGEAT